MEATVVIPNYNGAAFLGACLDSLLRQTRPAAEVIVVDNGSTDASADLIRSHPLRPRLIALEQNYGFAAAVNRGIKAAGTEVVALLNNDAEADPGWLATGLDFLEHEPRAASAASLILCLADRSRVDSAGVFFPPDGRPRPRGSGLPPSLFSEPVEVIAACAGAAFYRREIFAQAGFFEESFFAYLEDVDLGLRWRRRGYPCVLVPQAVVYHHGSATFLQDRPGPKPVDSALRVRLIARNRLRLLARHLPSSLLLRFSPLLALGLLRSAFYHTFISGQQRPFWAGLLEGARLFGRDRRFYQAECRSGLFEEVAELMVCGERPWER